jgi:hypothetical protein
MNKNMSEDYKKSYGQVSHPEEGTRYAAGKGEAPKPKEGTESHVSMSDESEPAWKYKFGTDHPVTEAKEDPGVAKRCHDHQLGRGDRSMSKTGGKLGDATNHPQAGTPAENEGSGDNHI